LYSFFSLVSFFLSSILKSRKEEQDASYRKPAHPMDCDASAAAGNNRRHNVFVRIKTVTPLWNEPQAAADQLKTKKSGHE
jgi:hypothetical protein